MIEVKNVSFSYNQEDKTTEVLKNMSLTVNQGEFLVILGRNGSGKSTLAKLLNAVLVPDSGTVTVMGMDTKDEQHLFDIRACVGMVFQNPDNQIVASVVEEDVAFAPENLGVPSGEIKKRVEESLKAVGMSHYRKHAPHLLSGGQKQRVAIAGVLAMNPECIVLDEPTAMLDPIGRLDVLKTVQKLNREEGMTVVLITHHMEEAVEADRVVVVHHGEIVKSGSPREIFSNVNEMKEMGLAVPQVTELAHELIGQGVTLRNDVLTEEELLEELLPLLEESR
ncbi:MAG: energy-coupling factor transporter ATPase [Ruminococcaceae bacterium]|nr:energy-coupling factor transporter ATPase [Oscillospiraceae bacterium]